MAPPKEPAKPGRKFSFTVNGKSFESPDGTIDGDDVRRIAGLVPSKQHVLVQIRRPGCTSVGLNDPVDLTGSGTETFRVWKADGVRNFTIDEVGCEWGDPIVTETDLREITGHDDDREFYLERENEADRPIDQQHPVDLREPGAESILTRPALITIFVNTVEKRVQGPQITFNDLVILDLGSVPEGPNIVITVDYGRGPKENPKGSMKPGQSVYIKNRMVFDVTATDRS